MASKGIHQNSWLKWFVLVVIGAIVLFVAKSCSVIDQGVSVKAQETENVNTLSGKELLSNIQESMNAMKSEMSNIKTSMSTNTGTRSKTMPDLDAVVEKVLAKIDTVNPQRGSDVVSTEIAALKNQIDNLSQSRESEFHIQSLKDLSSLSNFERIVPLDKQSDTGERIETLPGKVSEPAQSIPVYGLQPSMLLRNVRLETGVIGQIPNVGNQVRRKYPFFFELSGQNLASQGKKVPGLNKVRGRGWAIGNATVGCAEGYITSLTFTFNDGTYDFVDEGLGSAEYLGVMTSLPDENGYPCVPGQYVSNAPQYLASATGLAFFAGAGSALADAQITRTTTGLGGTVSNVTGSRSKVALGGAIDRSSDVAINYYEDRLDATFDAVLVPATTLVDIRITKPVIINYNPNGLKIDYTNTALNSQDVWWETLQ